MPAPIPGEARQAIVADIESGQKSARQIASDHGVSPSTVHKISRDAGLEESFERSNTENATRAHVADMAAQRAQLAQAMLDDAHKLRERAWSEYQAIANGPDGPTTVTLDLPPLRDTQAAYTSMGIALDKHLALVRHDADPGTDSTRSMLADLGRALGAAADQLTDGETRET